MLRKFYNAGNLDPITHEPLCPPACLDPDLKNLNLGLEEAGKVNRKHKACTVHGIFFKSQFLKLSKSSTMNLQ